MIWNPLTAMSPRERQRRELQRQQAQSRAAQPRRRDTQKGHRR